MGVPQVTAHKFKTALEIWVVWVKLWLTVICHRVTHSFVTVLVAIFSGLSREVLDEEKGHLVEVRLSVCAQAAQLRSFLFFSHFTFTNSTRGYKVVRLHLT
jgi:hypothetical protein